MSKNTVFIIGAGASSEANLPFGDELMNEIAQLLDIRFDTFGYKVEHGDYQIVDALRYFIQQKDGTRSNIDPYQFKAWQIRDALPLAISIDNYIDEHRDDDKIALCCKLAIVRSILRAEQNSLLYFEEMKPNSQIDYDAISDTWYSHFFKLIKENCSKKDELEDRFKSITLIIFNYDRCIEHFMFNAIKQYYDTSEEEAAEIVNYLNIFHPYGSVGTLKWGNQKSYTKFGADLSPQQLFDISQKIKTFAEGTDPDLSEILKIREHMSTADRLVFMGFAFHKLNMRLIKPKNEKELKNIEPECYATTYNISSSDKRVIGDQINYLYGKLINTNMANKKCCTFFTEFWRSLSF